ncbi:MAG: Rieske 2Fe-2S domain-containing protein [Sandaracinaceae bacterium]
MTVDSGTTAPRSTAPSLARRAREVGMSPNHWYPGAFREELASGGTLATRFWGEPVVLYRGEDGVVHALEDRCAHRQIKLSHGSVEGCDLVCLYHGWTYAPDGRLVGMKHDRFGKRLPRVAVRSYPVRERYGIVWFFPGDPELAATTPLVEIPDAEGPDRWSSLHFAYTWRAHHSMVIDNLCNLTHLWVHGRWVPYGDTLLAGSTYDGERITLHWEHDLRRDALHPFTAPIFRRSPGSNRSDTKMIYDYPYQSALSNRRVRSTNFMLPLDETHTRVFTFQLWQPPRVPASTRRLSAPAFQPVMSLLRPITRVIFEQDGFTVEEEQAAWEEHRERPFPEPNPTVKSFHDLTVRKWEAYQTQRARGGLTPEERAEQARVKVL